MDPISLIMAALVAGASRAGATAVDQAGKDAYDRLKVLVERRFGGDPAKRRALESLEENPAGPAGALTEALVASGVRNDAEALHTAQQLLEHRDPEGAARGVYTVRVGGSAKGIVVGDQNRVSFGDSLKDDP
jgi:hypothetical protein